MDLLQSINLDSKCIHEITVNYRNNSSEKIDIAKLKNSSAILKISFPIASTQLGSEYILNNMDEILRNEREEYYTQVQTHFQDIVDVGEEYEIEEIWVERPVV